jgi:hypothetical protein
MKKSKGAESEAERWDRRVGLAVAKAKAKMKTRL